jgi:hypothetical protein
MHTEVDLGYLKGRYHFEDVSMDCGKSKASFNVWWVRVAHTRGR